MIRGLYTACAGMLVQMTRQDVLSNNLANVNSNGFKKDIVISQEFPAMLLERMGEKASQGASHSVTIGSLGTGSSVLNIATDYSPGSYRATENPFDLALGPETYFAVETPRGVAYTRNGAFAINAEGRLVNADGYSVLGNNGYIETEGKLGVDEYGQIIVDGEVTNALKLVKITNPDRLTKVGNNMFTDSEGEAEEQDNPRVLSGYLEMSNVNAVREMVDLITVVRAYEVLQKVVQAQDDTLDKVINQAGSL